MPPVFAGLQLKYLVTTAFAVLAFPAVAHAQEAQAAEEESAPVTLSGELGIVSDYRFRGVSLSDNDFAVQGALTLSTQMGFYSTIWASNIAEYGGAKTEIDVTGGWSGPVGPLTADVNVVGYFYPSGEGVNYYEVAGSLSKEFGPLGAKVGVAYSPKQDNIGGVDNTYVYGEANYAITGLPVTLIIVTLEPEGRAIAASGAGVGRLKPVRAPDRLLFHRHGRGPEPDHKPSASAAKYRP